jgi:thymidylate synthase
MKQYLDVVDYVLANGTRKENRTGVDTLSCFNVNYSLDLTNGFPLMTTKFVSWKNIVIELLWFLSGSTDIKLLWKHGCKFWDAWADPVTGQVPSAYGNFWRNFPVHTNCTKYREDGSHIEEICPTFNDQIKFVIDQLNTNPMSRRMVVTAWAPGNAQTSALPPCHSVFMVNVQNIGLAKSEQMICLHLTQRSADIALGVPYNIASYALLTELLARFSGIKAGIFGHTMVDAHIYTSKPDGTMAEYDHVPGLKEQLTRKPKPFPKLTIADDIRNINDIEALLDKDTDTIMSKFILEGYNPDPVIKFKVAV